MIEAGGPSTGVLLDACERATPPGVVMVAPSEVPRNALRAKSEGRAKEG
jgi:hypothetical protein